MFENISLSKEYMDIVETQRDFEVDLLSRENVVGVAVGNKITNGVDTKKPCLTVYVENKLGSAFMSVEDLIPSKLGSTDTDVVETHAIMAGDQDVTTVDNTIARGVDANTLRTRQRPVEGGYSISHPEVTAGTYATAVVDANAIPGIPPRYYLLSNNHVIANSNDASVGDPIIQPGTADGGSTAGDVVARLSRFVPIKFDGSCNFVDAAIAEGEFHDLDREVYWIGYPGGVAGVEVGDEVRKTGRTTNYTSGRVIGVNATMNVNYGGGRVGMMCRQIVTTNMSAGGDSGSLLVDANNDAVGLLFAGSSRVTIHNDIRIVNAMLDIRIA